MHFRSDGKRNDGPCPAERLLRTSEWGFGVGLRAIVLGLTWGLALLAGRLLSAQAEATTPPPRVMSASEPDYPPFSFVDATGEADGFSVALLRAALAVMGRDVEFRVGFWHEIMAALAQGEIAALPLVGRTPEREDLFDFTVPYMTLHGALVVRRDMPSPQGLADLAGRRVAVMRNDNAEEFLRREPRDFDIVSTATFPEAFDRVAAGDADAVLVQRLLAVRLLQERGRDDLHVVERPVLDFRQDFCFAVRKGDSATLALLNEGLALVNADGTFRRLHAQWFATLEVPRHRRLIIGGDQDYPPYEFLDSRGRPSGFVTELTRAIARELGLDVEIRLGPWADIRAAFERGELDALQGMLYSAERSRLYGFTPPHSVIHYVGVVRRGEGQAPRTPADLAGRRIVVQQGDIAHDRLIEQGHAEQTVAVRSPEEALRELAGGLHDCALVSRRTALYWIDKHGWTNLELGREPFLSPEYGYAVARDHKALLEQLSEGLILLRDSGEYQRLSDRWMGVYDRDTSRRLIRRTLLVFAAPLLLLCLLAVAWSWSLRRHVVRRTAALQRSEAHFRALVEGAPDAIYVQHDGRFVFLNPAACRLFGANTAAELVGTEVLDHFHPAERADARERMEQINVKREAVPVREHRIVRPDGAETPVEVSAVPFQDGAMCGALVFLRDITPRKQAQKRVWHLNRVLSSIRDINQLIVREHDRNRLIRECCRLLADHRGYAAAMVILTDDGNRPVAWSEAGLGAAFDGLRLRLEQGELPACVRRALNSPDRLIHARDREQDCGDCPLTACVRASDSLCVRLENSGTVFGFLLISLDHHLGMDDEEQRLLCDLAGDIAYALRALRLDADRLHAESERLLLQDQLSHAQKMEAVGRLAGGVAHDFRNMISVIRGYTEMALEDLKPDDALRGDLAEILKASGRATEITEQLLTFARKQAVNPELLILDETVGPMLSMLQRLIGEDVKLIWHPGNERVMVRMDPVQLHQILTNLCVNAREAIQGTGVIVIKTGMTRVEDGHELIQSGINPGEYVRLTVTDDGCGMSEETRRHVFEPFFTTRKSGGTGLGLATVYGIVHQNHGAISVYSEPGKGASFHIFLPRTRAESVQDGKSASEAFPAMETGTIPKSRGETILLVEDDHNILQMACRMVESLGYQVLSSGIPEEALRLAQAHPGKIDLLMTDVVMPGMNGRELADRVTALLPDIRILFMSGYTANVIIHRGMVDEGLNFIQKPFSIEALAQKIRLAIENPVPSP